MFQIGSVLIDIVSLFFTIVNIALWVAIIVFIVRYLKAKKDKSGRYKEK